jgi:hypothetical protein
MNIGHMDESIQALFFENIDRVINAERIKGLQELQKLVKFIQHLIDTILNQIAGGMLSEKGAKIKILHLFAVIQHCQIGNHPKIKAMVNQLKHIYNLKFKSDVNRNWLNFKPKPLVLTAGSIHHYIEGIKDSQSDPIYSEQPKSLIDVAEKTMEHIPKSDVELSKYYLSKLIDRNDNHKKIKAYLENSESEKPHNTVERNLVKKVDKRLNFDRIRFSLNQTVTTTTA